MILDGDHELRLAHDSFVVSVSKGLNECAFHTDVLHLRALELFRGFERFRDGGTARDHDDVRLRRPRISMSLPGLKGASTG